jgi:hypothetical protein
LTKHVVHVRWCPIPLQLRFRNYLHIAYTGRWIEGRDKYLGHVAHQIQSHSFYPLGNSKILV